MEQIYTEISSFNRYQLVSSKFPDYKLYSPMCKVLIQTKDNVTYGGSMWAYGQYMDANGYYWIMTPHFLKLLRSSCY